MTQWGERPLVLPLLCLPHYRWSRTSHLYPYDARNLLSCPGPSPSPHRPLPRPPVPRLQRENPAPMRHEEGVRSPTKQ